MTVLVACEESQRVCSAFLERGHDAYSIDLKSTSGPYPERHIQKDVISYLINNPFYRWDLIIAHPPCTYLTVAGNKWYNAEHVTEERLKAREDAVKFFMFFVEYQRSRNCKMAIENFRGNRQSNGGTMGVKE